MRHEAFETGRGTVHAWQCDHMGHINIRAYSELFEQALWHVFNHVGITPSMLRNSEIAMAGVRQDIQYFKELYKGDLVRIQSYLSKFTEKSLTMVHEMFNVETGEKCASCEITALCLDPSTRKARPFPPQIFKNGLESIVERIPE